MFNNCFIFDIDDTLIVSPKGLFTTKDSNGNIVDSSDIAKMSESEKNALDYSDWSDKNKVYRSIIEGTFVSKTFKFLNIARELNADIVLLSARQCESAVTLAMQRKFESYNIQHFNVHCINDKYYSEVFPADMTISQKKLEIIKNYSELYNSCFYFDDDKDNIKTVQNAMLDNVKTYQI